MKTSQADGRRRALKRSLDEVIDAAENLLRATADEATGEYGDARDQVRADVRAAASRLAGHAQEFAGEARALGTKGQRLVRDNALKSVGVGAAVGLLAGVLLARR